MMSLLGLGILGRLVVESRFADSFRRRKKERLRYVLEEGHENGPRAETMNCNLRQVLAAILKGLFLNLLGFDLLSSSMSRCTGTCCGVTWRHKEEPSQD